MAGPPRGHRAPVCDRPATRGISIRVHGGMPFTESGIGSNLAPDASATVPLVVLRQRANLKKVTV
jgi:hypothetical protein